MAGPHKYPEIVNNSHLPTGIVPLGGEFDKKNTKCLWISLPSRGWKQTIGALYQQNSIHVAKCIFDNLTS